MSRSWVLGSVWSAGRGKAAWWAHSPRFDPLQPEPQGSLCGGAGLKPREVPGAQLTTLVWPPPAQQGEGPLLSRGDHLFTRSSSPWLLSHLSEGTMVNTCVCFFL